jgi:4-hydroxybenzoate polyprenyltransferase
MSRRNMIILGIVIVLVAVFAGAFIHPLLFLIGLSVLFVAFFADW